MVINNYTVVYMYLSICNSGNVDNIIGIVSNVDGMVAP